MQMEVSKDALVSEQRQRIAAVRRLRDAINDYPERRAILEKCADFHLSKIAVLAQTICTPSRLAAPDVNDQRLAAL